MGEKIDNRIMAGALHRHLGITKSQAQAWRRKRLLPPVVHAGPYSYYRRLDLVRLINAGLSAKRELLRLLANQFLEFQKTAQRSAMQ